MSETDSLENEKVLTKDEKSSGEVSFYIGALWLFSLLGLVVCIFANDIAATLAFGFIFLGTTRMLTSE